MKTKNISAKEKKAAISLLEAKLENLTGKPVQYIDPQMEATKKEIKRIHEKLEKLTGKKVVFSETKSRPSKNKKENTNQIKR